MNSVGPESPLHRKNSSEPKSEDLIKDQNDTDLEAGDGTMESVGPTAAMDEKQEQLIDRKIVDWSGPSDPENPMNWPVWRKWCITALLGSLTFVITFASSVFSTATIATAKEFGESVEVMVLGTSLFVFGFAFGPLIWSPLSEVYGRRWPLLFGYFVFAIFQVPVAVAQNVYTILICRFLGGFFGSSALGIVAGILVDIWQPIQRGIAMSLFASATFVGPVAGPIIGGFITQSHLGWRWTAYITGIMALLFGGISFVLVPETFAPRLLTQRARKTRFATGDWAMHAKAEESLIDIRSLISRYLSRPLAMLFLEPILFLMTIYMAFVYGIIYLLFEAYPVSFQEERAWNAGVGSLPFIAITGGVFCGAGLIVWYSKAYMAPKMQRIGRLQPEERLPPMMVGGALLPAGMFWFAWTSNPSILWVPQVLSGVFIGAGVLMIFLQGLNYIIDVYLMNANSAIAANGLIRSSFGAGFPLFATAMYHKLGVNWATSLLGFLGVAMFPVPILFYLFGPTIRKWSRYSPKFPPPPPPQV